MTKNFFSKGVGGGGVSEQLDAATVSCRGLSKHLEKSGGGGEEEEERLRAWERMWVCLCGKAGRKKNDHVTSLIRPPGLMYAAGQKNGHSGSALSLPPPPLFSRAFSFSDLYALRGSAHRRNFGALRQRGDKHG